MTQSADLTAYKAALNERKGKKKTNTYYFPIGRTISTIGGVFQMVNMRYISAGVKFLFDGNFESAGKDFSRMFNGGDVKAGATMIATGIVLGKALDHTKANPRVKMGKYGVKLV